MKYQVAVLLTIEAPSYEEAVRDADSWVIDPTPTPPPRRGSLRYGQPRTGVLDYTVEHDYEHDNDGQRVLYLHPEEKPIT
jgi:hypothetical protein